WKLLASCGVHVITLSTVQLFLLVERRYPLSRFTLKQLVNVTRLQVEEEIKDPYKLRPIKISSGSTTTHSDISLSEYDSFIFDLANDQFPPTNTSDFANEKFADELAHIISLPKYDCFYFRNLPDPGELISILNSGICENLSSTTLVNLPVEDDHFPLLAYVVWIFLSYLTYHVSRLTRSSVLKL
nr:hypothetical protein [Tanacetum cinerariifolium]